MNFLFSLQVHLQDIFFEVNLYTYKQKYYTLYLLSAFSLAKSLQFILKISATYRLVNYLLADN